MISKSWITLRFYGERHLVPAMDEVMHTVPMCWCPLKIRVNVPTMDRLYEHFSLAEIRNMERNK